MSAFNSSSPIAMNASLVGAKTVIRPGCFNVSSRPAAFTASQNFVRPSCSANSIALAVGGAAETVPANPTASDTTAKHPTAKRIGFRILLSPKKPEKVTTDPPLKTKGYSAVRSESTLPPASTQPGGTGLTPCEEPRPGAAGA